MRTDYEYDGEEGADDMESEEDGHLEDSDKDSREDSEVESSEDRQQKGVNSKKEKISHQKHPLLIMILTHHSLKRR